MAIPPLKAAVPDHRESIRAMFAAIIVTYTMMRNPGPRGSSVPVFTKTFWGFTPDAIARRWVEHYWINPV